MKSHLAFVRRMDRALEQFNDPSCPDTDGSMYLEPALQGDDVPPKLLEMGKDLIAEPASGKLAAFEKAFAKFKDYHYSELLAQRCVGILNLVEPFIIDHVKSRRMDPAKPGNLAYTIQQIISDEYNPVSEINKLYKLVKLQSKVIEATSNGAVVPDSALETIKQLKEELGA